MSDPIQGMTVAGWAFFIFGWGSVIALNIYCFSKLFRKKRGE